jgi:hypothetical protein
LGNLYSLEGKSMRVREILAGSMLTLALVGAPLAGVVPMAGATPADTAVLPGLVGDYVMDDNHPPDNTWTFSACATDPARDPAVYLPGCLLVEGNSDNGWKARAYITVKNPALWQWNRNGITKVFNCADGSIAPGDRHYSFDPETLTGKYKSYSKTQPCPEMTQSADGFYWSDRSINFTLTKGKAS